MANEVVLTPTEDTALSVGDLCKDSRNPGILIVTALLDERVATIDIGTGYYEMIPFLNLTPLGPCRIEVTPC